MGRFALMLIVALTVLAARMPVAPARAAVPVSSAHDLVVLADSLPAPSRFVALAGASGTVAHVLPPGLFDHSGSRLYATVQLAPGEVRLEAIEVQTGRVLASLRLAGEYTTGAGDFNLLPRSAAHALGIPSMSARPVWAAARAHSAQVVAGWWAAGMVSSRPSGGGEGGWSAIGVGYSALSWNGHWLALREIVTPNRTRFVVIDTRTMRAAARLDLPGSLPIDAIGDDGVSLFLIQPLSLSGNAYQVRVADTRSGRLDPRPVREPGERPGSMSGIAWTRVWSPDGTTLYTLYIEQNGHAFVHELDLSTRQAHCLDLPNLHASYDQMVPSVLDMAPDGRTLYVVNAWRGWSLTMPVGQGAGPVRLVRLTRRAGMPEDPRVATAITPDGRAIFVATNHGVWAVDAHTLAIRARYLPGLPFASVALSADGRRLYALRAFHPVLYVLDVTVGRLLGSHSFPSMALSSIQQITSDR